MISLIPSRVDFDKDTHTYLLDGIVLQGITGRIHDRLFPNKYDGISEATLAAAAARGTLVHEAIQLHDQTAWSPTFEEVLQEPLYAAVDAYEAMKQEAGLSVVDNEHLVTDGHTYASAIDIVAEEADGGCVLIDVKTTYSIDREYVSWQLSVYADFLEASNPTLTVKRLACLWIPIRDGQVDKVQLIDVPRKASELVSKMLYTQESLDFGLTPIDARLADLNMQKALVEAQIEEARAEAREIMETNGMASWKTANATYTMRKATTQMRFDTRAFRAAEPAIYEKYAKAAEVPASLSIRFA